MSALRRHLILLLEIVGVVLFVGLLAYALTRPPPVAGPAGTVDWAEMEGSDTRWSGIYLGDDKIGFSSSQVEPLEVGFRTIDRSFLRLGSMGTTREIHTHATAELDDQLRARSFAFEMQTGDTVFRARGEGTTVHYSIGEGLEETMIVPELPLLSGFHPRLLAGAEPGSVVELPYLDPSTMTRDAVTYRVGRREPVPGLEGIEARRIDYDLKGAAVSLWIDEDGQSIREEGLLGMVVLREPRERALSRGWPAGDAVDVVQLSAVPVDRPIDGARTSRVLVVRLHGPDSLAPLLEAAHGERYDGQQLGIHVPAAADLQSYVLPATDEGFAPFLAAEPLIEVEDPAIQEAVNGVLADELDAETAARRLVDWTFNALEKVPEIAPPSARNVLEQRRGDCNEHTALYTAMARAAGLPTRVAAGIVYTDTLFSKGSFYYHAWPEVWLGTWVPVDPTFGQFPADATHIKLVEGGLDRQTELIGVIGALSAEIVEVR